MKDGKEAPDASHDKQGINNILSVTKADKPFDEIVGLDDAKEKIRYRFDIYFRHKNELKNKPSKGMLLYGYPGTGKTMFIKATMEEYKDSPNLYFKILNHHDLTRYIGNTSEKTFNLIQGLRNQAKGKDIVLIIDEVDKLLPEKTTSEIVNERIKSLLDHIDGVLDDGGLYVMCCTNHPNKICAAFLRSGRVDTQIEVSLPNDIERKELIHKYIGSLGLDDNCINSIYEFTPKWTGADYTRLGRELEESFIIKREMNPSYVLNPEDIIKKIMKVDRTRKKNFKVFEDEYKAYLNEEDYSIYPVCAYAGGI